MKVAIMQPYAFPYLGYFQLIHYVDKWVIFDDVQYISKGWVNRNRILHPDPSKEWQYFTIPVRKHTLDTRIKDVDINEDIDWRSQLLGKLTSYKKKAPFYSETIGLVKNCLSFKREALSEWVEYALVETCKHLGVNFDYSIYSKMDIEIQRVDHAGQWALEIADTMGASEYVNMPGGYEIFKEKEFKERGIDLRFIKPGLSAYQQNSHVFVPGLSIIDVLMWNDRQNILEMLADYKILSTNEIREYI